MRPATLQIAQQRLSFLKAANLPHLHPLTRCYAL